MSCRCYDDDNTHYYEYLVKSEEANKLSRIACKALYLIERLYASASKDKEIDNISLLSQVLDDSEVKEWWPTYKTADITERNRIATEAKLTAIKIAEKAELKRRRMEILSRLSEEERKILGKK